MAEKSLHGQPQDLTEHRIGERRFWKAEDYSVVEDSSVRVHVRQLRLKLHEYFDGEGRDETCIVEIPKGGLHNAISARRAESFHDACTSRNRPATQILDQVAALGARGAASRHYSDCLASPATACAGLLPPGRYRLSSIRPTALSRWWLRTSTTA